MLKKEFTIIGWNDWYGDTTHYIHAPQPYLSHGYPDKIDLKEAEAFGREMAEHAMRIYSGERYLLPEIPHGLNAGRLWVISNIAHPSGQGEDGAEQMEIPIIDTKNIYIRYVLPVLITV